MPTKPNRFILSAIIAIVVVAIPTTTDAPQTQVVTYVVTIEDPQRTQANPGQRCQTTTGTHHAKTLFGNTFFKFGQRVEWCSDGVNVTSIGFREHTWSEASDHAVFQGLVEDYATPTPRREAVSMKKGHVENNAPTKGSIKSIYPFVKITLRGDGSATPETGE